MPGLITGDFQLLIMSPVTRDSCPTHACPSSTINYPPVNKSSRPSFHTLFSIPRCCGTKAIVMVLKTWRTFQRCLKSQHSAGSPYLSTVMLYLLYVRPLKCHGPQKLPEGKQAQWEPVRSALVLSTHKASHMYSKHTHTHTKSVTATAGAMTC